MKKNLQLRDTMMNYISVSFYIFLFISVLFYYVLPIAYRWYFLLIASFVFYYLAAPKGIPVFLSMIIVSYGLGIAIEKQRSRKIPLQYRRGFLAFSVFLVLLPLLAIKLWDFMPSADHRFFWLAPLGLSFFTLQIISYLTDIYKGTIDRQHHFLKYALFISFFPQIIQGPIPRYEQSEDQLVTGHMFDEKNFSKGLHLILWGLFLKYMIADKSAVIVNTVFDHYEGYGGFYVLVAGILYSIQLYTDFLSCVCICQGSANLFGIHLIDNFHHPYRADSIRDFWNRWHISLSRWLRDYIYIPLGGNRKGNFRKYLNLLITFLVSGFWHGHGLQFILWGLLHGFYQVIGQLTVPVRSALYAMFRIPRDGFFGKLLQRVTTFFLVMIGWIIFRARNISQGLVMLRSMFTAYNPWILFDDSLFSMGLVWKEWIILLLSILVLIAVECIQEKTCIRDRILAQPLIFRWIIYLSVIWVIWVFGSYGSEFIAQNFIYGEF